MEPFKAERWRTSLAVACFVALIGASVAGLLVRHRVAYDLQIRRGAFVVRSVPRESAAMWLKETLRADPSREKRFRAATLLPDFADVCDRKGVLLGALADEDRAVRKAAWNALVYPGGSVKCSFHSPSLSSLSTKELLAALQATACEEPSRVLFEQLYTRDEGAAAIAAGYVLAHSTAEDTIETVLYYLGAPAYGRGMILGGITGVVSRVRDRGIAQQGLGSPVDHIRVRCARFLVMLGGQDLDDADRAWVESIAKDEILLVDAMGSFAGYEGYIRWSAEPRTRQRELIETLRSFLDGVGARYGLAVAKPFARAGSDCEDPGVAELCHGWLKEHAAEDADAACR